MDQHAVLAIPLLVVLTWLVVAGVLSILPFGPHDTLSDVGDTVQTLWQVHAALLGIIVTLIVLLMQAVSGGADHDTPFEAIVRASRLKWVIYGGLTLNAILGLVAWLSDGSGAGWMWACPLAASAAAFFFGYLLSTGWLLAKTLQMMRPSFVRGTVQERAVRALESAILDMVEMGSLRAILKDTVDKEALGFLLLSFQAPVAMALSSVTSARRGMVVDVDLARLRELSRWLKGSVPTAEAGVLAKAWLQAVPGVWIDRESYPVARVSPVDAGDQTERLVREAFVISAVDDAGEDRLEVALRQLESQATRVAKESHLT
ncbi:MAG: hypothetical protein ACYC5O_21035, partial [Anaerolineae bacterium]